MQDLSIFTPIINNYESKGIEFSFDERVVSENGRSRLREKIAIAKGKQGINQDEIKQILIDPYNKLVKEQAIEEIKAEIAAEQESALLASQATAKELADLREQLAKQAEENDAKTAANEKARKKPLLQITAYFGLSLTVLVALVLVGLNFFNATYFLGENLHWSVLFIFALLFGASFVYFALSRNGKALKMLVWVIPFDLVIATLVKPFLGNTKTLQLFTEDGFNWVGFAGLLLFLTVYGIQLYHAGNAVAKLLNPKELSQKEEEEHLTRVLDSIQ